MKQLESMPAHQMMDLALEHGGRKAITFALNISRTLVDRYTYAPESEGGEGKRCDAEAVRIIIEALRAQQAPNSELPLEWLCAHLGYFPPIRQAGPAMNLDTFASFLTTAGDLIHTMSNSLADRVIDDAELEEIDHNHRLHEAAVANHRVWIEDEKQRRTLLITKGVRR